MTALLPLSRVIINLQRDVFYFMLDLLIQRLERKLKLLPQLFPLLLECDFARFAIIDFGDDLVLKLFEAVVSLKNFLQAGKALSRLCRQKLF